MYRLSLLKHVHSAYDDKRKKYIVVFYGIRLTLKTCDSKKSFVLILQSGQLVMISICLFALSHEWTERHQIERRE